MAGFLAKPSNCGKPKNQAPKAKGAQKVPKTRSRGEAVRVDCVTAAPKGSGSRQGYPPSFQAGLRGNEQIQCGKMITTTASVGRRKGPDWLRKLPPCKESHQWNDPVDLAMACRIAEKTREKPERMLKVVPGAAG